MFRRIISFFLILGTFVPSRAQADEARFTASFQIGYQGQYQDLYTQQVERVRLLIQQAQIEISSRLGLVQYRQGFRFPLAVRFTDTTHPGAEHALAYVHFVQTTEGLAQEMVVNLSACAQNPSDFDSVFYHEMTHAVMLDALDPAQALALPHWLHEGLAAYISGEGPERVHFIAQHFSRTTVFRAVHDIDLPPDTVDYAESYVAIKYIEEKYSSNGVQGLVRDLIQGKNAKDSLEDITGESYDLFRKHLQDYTLSVYQREARTDIP